MTLDAPLDTLAPARETDADDRSGQMSASFWSSSICLAR